VVPRYDSLSLLLRLLPRMDRIAKEKAQKRRGLMLGFLKTILFAFVIAGLFFYGARFFTKFDDPKENHEAPP